MTEEFIANSEFRHSDYAYMHSCTILLQEHGRFFSKSAWPSVAPILPEKLTISNAACSPVCCGELEYRLRVRNCA